MIEFTLNLEPVQIIKPSLTPPPPPLSLGIVGPLVIACPADRLFTPVAYYSLDYPAPAFPRLGGGKRGGGKAKCANGPARGRGVEPSNNHISCNFSRAGRARAA